MTAESRGARLHVADGAPMELVSEAARALAERLVSRAGRARRRDVVVETVNGERASSSSYAPALRDAGFRSGGGGMRYYATVR